jgi:predicted NBD/HSP70 family sugar kinase
MYVGIDIGGTKTLVAILEDNGVIIEHEKFPTPKDYGEFLVELGNTMSHFVHHDFKAGGCGVAARLDRETGKIIKMGNLPWVNVPFQNDLEEICKCPMVIENDAKMGGLSEALLLKDKYKRALYVAIGTGIGTALVDRGIIDDGIGDAGGRALMMEHRGKLVPWEQFAGGRALANRYGKPAKEITDPTTWRTICRYLAQGIVQIIAICEPDVIIIGGGVGLYFDRYGKILKEEVDKYALPLVTMPDIVSAQRPDEAVIYGCYDLAKQTYTHE